MSPRTTRPHKSTSASRTRPIRHRSPDILSGAPLHRVWLIHAKLVREESFTAETLATELEVAACTIKRHIEMMRDRLGLPIEWDAVGHTYFYSRPCDTLPLLRIDAGEALAFALAGRVLGGLRGSPLGQMLQSVLRKIAPVLGGAVSVAVDSVDHALSTPTNRFDEEIRHFMPLLESILHRRQLRILYSKPGSPKYEKRLVHPLHLAELDGRWVLVAHDPTRRAVRNFLLARIREVHAEGDTFQVPGDFEPAAYLRGCMGRFAGDREIEVRIALDAHAASYARETPWHPSQQLSDRPDGGAELVLRLNHLAGARTAVLRWGRRARVLAPAELRDEVRAELEAALASYQSADMSSA